MEGEPPATAPAPILVFCERTHTGSSPGSRPTGCSATPQTLTGETGKGGGGVSVGWGLIVCESLLLKLIRATALQIH